MNIQAIMQAKYPGADLSRYFAFLDAATGEDHAHHSAPRAEFPELATEPENIRAVSFQEHFYAHYLLALAVPECRPFQTTVYFMANIFAREIRTDELPFFAEVYERGMRAQAERLKALHADPEFAKAHAERGRKCLKALNARRRAERSLADALIAYMHESQPGIKSLTALV